MIVKNVKFKNNKVEIVLEDNSFFISKENYIENPVAIDSDISEKTIENLLNYEKIIDAKLHVIKLLNRKILTESEIDNCLKDREVMFNDRKIIINNLKNIGLINDEYACDVLVDSLLIKRKGKREIYKVLKEKKIKEDIISKSMDNIDDEVYKDNFTKVCEKYLKMYNGKSSKVKDNMVRQKLKEYGYEESLINSFGVEYDRESDIELARKFLLKILKNNSITISDHQNINKIKAKLANKGFNYDIINLVIGEVINDETY